MHYASVNLKGANWDHFSFWPLLDSYSCLIYLSIHTYSNIVSEDISDFSCLSLCNKQLMEPVEILCANLSIQYDNGTFRVGCWVCVVSFEQKGLWSKSKHWRWSQCDSYHFFTQCKVHNFFFSCLNIFSAFTAYVCNTRVGSTRCSADKTLLKMDTWKHMK